MIALCVTGCFSDRGVAIEVDVGETGATSVELYIGKEACAENRPAGVGCATILPPGAPASLGDDHVWFRDDSSRYVADVKGHTATFQLKADKAIKLHESGEAPLSWPEVQALAAVEGVELQRSESAVVLRLPRAVITTPLKMVPV